MLGFGYGSGLFLLGGERLRDGKVVEPDVPVLEELLPLLLARDLVRDTVTRGRAMVWARVRAWAVGWVRVGVSFCPVTFLMPYPISSAQLVRTVFLPESRLRMVICSALSCSFFGSGWLKLVHWWDTKMTLSALRVSSTLMSPPSARRSWLGLGSGLGPDLGPRLGHARAAGASRFPSPSLPIPSVHAATNLVRTPLLELKKVFDRDGVHWVGLLDRRTLYLRRLGHTQLRLGAQRRAYHWDEGCLLVI